MTVVGEKLPHSMGDDRPSLAETLPVTANLCLEFLPRIFGRNCETLSDFCDERISDAPSKCGPYCRRHDDTCQSASESRITSNVARTRGSRGEFLSSLAENSRQSIGNAKSRFLAAPDCIGFTSCTIRPLMFLEDLRLRCSR